MFRGFSPKISFSLIFCEVKFPIFLFSTTNKYPHMLARKIDPEKEIAYCERNLIVSKIDFKSVYIQHKRQVEYGK